MKLSLAVPPLLQELKPYFSSESISLVEWRELVRRALGLGATWLSSGKYERALAEVTPFLPRSMARWSGEGLAAPLDVERLSREERSQIGDLLLQLYFHQLFLSPVVFLDLRLNQFHWEKPTKRLLWSAGRSWLRLEADFRQALLDLYRGFLAGDSSLIEPALRSLGLIGQQTSANDAARIKELLREQLGASGTGTVGFSGQRLGHTLHELASPIRRAGGRLSPDFAFIGLLLVSLHLSLERLGTTHDVRSLFLGGPWQGADTGAD